jgi:hypothetical protein
MAQGIDILAKVFPYDVRKTITFFQDYLYNPRQFLILRPSPSKSQLLHKSSS